jgi:hypothetical protein
MMVLNGFVISPYVEHAKLVTRWLSMHNNFKGFWWLLPLILFIFRRGLSLRFFIACCSERKTSRDSNYQLSYAAPKLR